MFKIYTATHKLIANELYEYVNSNYGIELNYENLLWGSIAPDILPKYKLYRHYYENSIDYIILRIAKVIFLNRFLDFRNCSYLALKMFSKDLGIISHYLSDFTCLAHADRWELPKSLYKHLKYEIELNEIAKTHEFEMIKFRVDELTPNSDNIFKQLPRIKSYISDVLDEYLEEQAFERDLNYALSLNKKIFDYVIEYILEYNFNPDFVFNY